MASVTASTCSRRTFLQGVIALSVSRLIPGGVTPAAASGFYDVTAHGVTMNDSTAASTNAILLAALSSRVTTAGGGTIWIPAGTLWVTQWDHLGTGVHLTGAGRGATTVKSQSGIPMTFTNASNCTIENLTIQTVSGSQALYTTANTNCVLNNVEFVGGSTGALFLDNSSGCLFTKLVVRDTGTAGKGMWVFKNMRKNAFSDIYVYNTGAHGLVVEAGSTDTGSGAVGPYDNTFTNLRLVNTCTNTQAAALALHGATGNTLTGIVIDTVGSGGQGIGFEEDQNAAQSDVGPGSENVITGVYLKDIGGYGISFTGSARNRVSGVCIHNINGANGGTGIAIAFQKGAGTDGVTPGDHDCLDNVVEDVDIRQTSANNYAYAVQFTGDGSELIHRNVVRNLRPGSPATGVVNFASSAVKVGANANRVLLASEGTVVTLTYSASITPALVDGSRFTIAATNTTAYTINAITNALPGAVVTFDILNSSGGTMGAITWNAVYKLAGAFTNPANTKRRTITFWNDGTDWVEVSRAAADI